MTSLCRLQRPIGLLLKGLIPVAALFFLALGMSSPAWATTYYISTAGSDSYDGLAPALVSGANGPFRSFQRAANAVRPGDSVQIRGGTYLGYGGSWGFAYNGTESSLITVTSYPGETVIIDGNNHALPSGAYTPLMQVYGDWYVISNIEFRYGSDSGLSILGDHCTVANITSHHNDGSGILAIGAYNTIKDCRAYYNSMVNEYGSMPIGWGFGISLCENARYSTIRNCTSWNNWGEGLSMASAYYCTIEDSVSYDNFSTNIYVCQSVGGLCQRNLSYYTNGNPLQPYVSSQNGIYVADEANPPDSSGNKVINNLCVGGDRCLLVGGDDFENTLIAHNTFANAFGRLSIYEASCVHFLPGSSSGGRFVNNIILQEDGVAISHLESTGVSFSYNSWSRLPVAGARGTGDVIGDPRLAKSGTVRPGDLTPGWFRILESSPVRDKAIVLSEVKEDFLKNPRGSTPDIGAFNFSNETSTLSASASGTPLTGTNPLTVNFSGNASGGTPPFTYEWKFGDGFTATSQNASHIYSAVGRYTATLVVFDGTGTSATDDIGVTVDSIADITALPVASVGASALTGTAPMSVNFAGSASGGTSPYTYSWSFGDGGTSTEQNPSHIYVKAGTYAAKFTVTDSVGKKGSGSATVIVASASTAAPTANFIAFPASGPAPHAVRFAGMASGGSSPYVYRWNFGDGTTSTERNPAHTYTLPGTYTVTLTVTDGRSASTVKTMTVRITQGATAGTTTGGATGKLRARLGLPARNPIFR